MRTLPSATVSNHYPGYHAFQTAHNYTKSALEKKSNKDTLNDLTCAVMNLNTGEERMSEEFGAQLNRIENYLATNSNSVSRLDRFA